MMNGKGTRNKFFEILGPDLFKKAVLINVYDVHVCCHCGVSSERIQKTLSFIGAAVLYGGLSTFLAFILLAASASYVFKTFFKVSVLWHEK